MAETSYTKQLLNVYARANKLGLLDIPLVARIFQTAYFGYKALLEDPFERFAKRHPELLRGGNIIDVGANIGYTVRVFAKRLSGEFKIFAFEPEERNYRFLREGLRRGGLEHCVVPIRASVGNENGTISLWLNPGHHADHRVVTTEFECRVGGEKCQSVPQTTLDTFMASQPCSAVSFIKIDVQGYELPVCQGMQQTLINNERISVAFEYSPEQMVQLGFESEALLQFFLERGFRLYALSQSGSLATIHGTQVESFLQKRAYFDIVATRAQITGD